MDGENFMQDKKICYYSAVRFLFRALFRAC